MEGKRRRIVFIGAGNVAGHLSLALALNSQIVQVWSRYIQNARLITQSLPYEAEAISNLDEVTPFADFYIISVRDDVVAEIIASLPPTEGIIAHTSGTVNVLTERPNIGVFYPLQTFTKNRGINLREVPFLVEANKPVVAEQLFDLAKSISDKVYYAGYAERQKIHLAAVFASNFATHLWAIAEDILRENTECDISILAPLMNETLAKTLVIGPKAALTGPARRNDIGTIESHLSQLDGMDKEIYKLLTQSIIKNCQ